MMKKLLLFCLTGWISAVSAQVLSVSETDMFRSGNMFLSENNRKYSDMEGTPYWKDTFEAGEILFVSEQIFEGKIRYDIAAQVFEFKNENGQVFQLEPAEILQIAYGGTQFIPAQKLRIDAIKKPPVYFQVLVTPAPYGLLASHTKKVVMPRRDGIAVPGQPLDSQKNKWEDEIAYYLVVDKRVMNLPKSVKKLNTIDAFQDFDLKTIVKKNKISVKKEADLIRLLNIINEL